MKYLFTILLSLLTFNVNAASFAVYDVTTGNGLIFTPGENFLVGQCSYSWGGTNEFQFEEFMQGASSYTVDTYAVGTNTRCTNLKTDITDNKIVIPYVNQTEFNRILGGQIISVSRVVTASTELVPTIFSSTDDPIETYRTIISAGTPGTTNYFHCTVVTDDLTHQWLMFAGVDSEIAVGYVLSMSWFGSDRQCADIRMTLDPALLTPDTAPVIVPIACPVDCVSTL